MNTFSVREAVEMALQTEILGYEFYTKLAGKFNDQEQLNSLFVFLATEEQKHEKIFSRLLDKLQDTEPEGWEEVQNYMRAMVESEFFLGKEKSLPSMDHLKSAGDALDFALGFEKETALFFVGLRDAVKDKGPVDDIIKEEKRHIMRLNNIKREL